mmetsp:Transcript_16104/g.44336  ORF Transcript_16104/g.44336 Transcript_16104/m.44336 type:complete len:210 (+) Transcript_16104:348-977(+)
MVQKATALPMESANATRAIRRDPRKDREVQDRCVDENETSMRVAIVSLPLCLGRLSLATTKTGCRGKPYRLSTFCPPSWMYSTYIDHPSKKHGPWTAGVFYQSCRGRSGRIWETPESLDWGFTTQSWQWSTDGDIAMGNGSTCTAAGVAKLNRADERNFLIWTWIWESEMTCRINIQSCSWRYSLASIGGINLYCIREGQSRIATVRLS